MPYSFQVNLTTFDGTTNTALSTLNSAHPGIRAQILSQIIGQITVHLNQSHTLPDVGPVGTFQLAVSSHGWSGTVTYTPFMHEMSTYSHPPFDHSCNIEVRNLHHNP